LKNQELKKNLSRVMMLLLNDFLFLFDFDADIIFFIPGSSDDGGFDIGALTRLVIEICD